MNYIPKIPQNINGQEVFVDPFSIDFVNRVISINCEINNLYGKYKDANEALLKNRAQFIKNIQNACQNLIKGNESKDDEDFILSLYRKLSSEDKEKIRKTISALVA